MGNPTTQAGWLAVAPLMGLSPANFVPSQYWDLANTTAANNMPPGWTNCCGHTLANWITTCASMLIARGLIYGKNNIGDCGLQTPLDFSNAELTSSAGQVVSGIASVAGIALPGIGIAIQAISTIFAHHAQAVQNEQTTICQVAGVINQVFAYYDQKVRSGSISPSTAYKGIQAFLQQTNSQLALISKSCDAGCVYGAIIQAHYAFVQVYYPAIAPPVIAPRPPASPPPLGIIASPGGVIPPSSTPTPVINRGTSETTGKNTNETPVLAQGGGVIDGGINFSSPTMMLLGIIALLILIVAVS